MKTAWPIGELVFVASSAHPDEPRGRVVAAYPHAGMYDVELEPPVDVVTEEARLDLDRGLARRRDVVTVYADELTRAPADAWA